MASTTLKTRIVTVNKTTAQWATETTVVLKGELAIEFLASGGAKLKVGDGTKTFAELPYVTMAPAEITTAINNAVTSASHTHSNKAILDAISAAFTTELKAKYDALVSNVQADWNAASGNAAILNKPTLGTAAASNVGDFASAAQGTKADSAVQKIKINGTEQPKTAGEVNLPAYPTKSSLGLDKVSNTADADKPVSTATQTELNKKANKATTLSGYGITDAYTKTETESKISAALSSVFVYKGNVDSYAKLPTTNNKIGDTYNVIAADKTHGVSAGDNVAWNGEDWDVLSGTIDLSLYLTAAETDGRIASALDTAKAYADSLGTKYATAAQGTKADSAVQSVTLGGTAINKANGTIALPAYPTTLPASDVSAWAKAATKPAYTKAEVGLGNVDNTADASKTVAKAGALTTARTIGIAGAVTGTAASFDGTGNVNITATSIDATKLTLAASDTLILDGSF